MKLSIVKFIPAISWFLFVTILLCLPGSDIPKVGFLEMIHFDKIVHMGLFAGLSFWVYMPFGFCDIPLTEKRNILIKIAMAALVYGIAMEFVQKYYIPGRSFDITDMIADGIGAFLPVVFQQLTDGILSVFKKKTAS